jgi:hypothetical protein
MLAGLHATLTVLRLALSLNKIGAPHVSLRPWQHCDLRARYLAPAPFSFVSLTLSCTRRELSLFSSLRAGRSVSSRLGNARQVQHPHSD